MAPTRRQWPQAHWPRRPSPCFATTCRWRLILNTSHMAPLRRSCSLDSTACRSVLTPDGPAQCPLTCQQVYTCITMLPLCQYLASGSANGLYPPPRKLADSSSLALPLQETPAAMQHKISRPRPPPAPPGVFGARCRTLCHDLHRLSDLLLTPSCLPRTVSLAPWGRRAEKHTASRLSSPPLERPIDSRGPWTAACSRPTQEDEKWSLANLRSRRLHLTWELVVIRKIQGRGEGRSNDQPCIKQQASSNGRTVSVPSGPGAAASKLPISIAARRSSQHQ